METNGTERKRRKVAGLTFEEMSKVRFEIATETMLELAGDILQDVEKNKVTAEDLLRVLIDRLGLNGRFDR